jgi:hypothetical protein
MWPGIVRCLSVRHSTLAFTLSCLRLQHKQLKSRDQNRAPDAATDVLGAIS